MRAPTRRTFLEAALLATVGCAKKSAKEPAGEASEPPLGPRDTLPKEGKIKLPDGATMPMRTLGKTGEKVSLLGLGGYHISVPREAEGIRILRARPIGPSEDPDETFS